MTEGVLSTKLRMPLWVRFVLAVSLALNLLVIGAIGGAFMRFGGPPGAMNERMSIGRALYGALPKEDRRALRATRRQSVDRGTMRQTRIWPELDAALRADPFVPATVETLLLQHAAALDKRQSAMRAGWLTILSEMTEAERVAYADRLQEHRDKRRPPNAPDRP